MIEVSEELKIQLNEMQADAWTHDPWVCFEPEVAQEMFHMRMTHEFSKILFWVRWAFVAVWFAAVIFIEFPLALVGLLPWAGAVCLDIYVHYRLWGKMCTPGYMQAIAEINPFFDVHSYVTGLHGPRTYPNGDPGR